MRGFSILFLTVLLGVALAASALAQPGSLTRHTGRIHSFVPAEGVLVIETVGPGAETVLVEVRIRQAEIVRVQRDPKDPWRFRERPTRVHRWPAGTFLTVTGRGAGPGIIAAERIEIVDTD